MRIVDVDEVLETYKSWLPQLSLEGNEKEKEAVETCISVLKWAPTVETDTTYAAEWVYVHNHYWITSRNDCLKLFKDETITNQDAIFHDWNLGFKCELCEEIVSPNLHLDWNEKRCPIGHYKCSRCDAPSKYGDENFCPSCGAKMSKQGDN